MNTAALVQKVCNFCHTVKDDGVGYGDHAGSGIPKIYRNWAGQHWRRPALYQVQQPEQTLMELRMSSLLPADAVADLEAHFGDRFTALGELERLASVTAAADGVLNHARLREMSTDHSTDITKRLSRLVRDGFLVPDGIGRGMVYCLPWQTKAGFRSELEASGDTDAGLSLALGVKTPELVALTPELGAITPELGATTPELALQAPGLAGGDSGVVPLVVSALSALTPEALVRLQQVAQPVSSRRRAAPDQVRGVVLALCDGQFMGLRVLAALLGRRDQNGSDLRKRILNPLVKQGLLLRAYPRPNDPRQAYRRAPQAAPDDSSILSAG